MKKVARNLAVGALIFALGAPGIAHSQKSITQNENFAQIELAPGNGGVDPIDYPTLNNKEVALEKTTLYPNPGKGMVNFSGHIFNEELTLKVISLTGKVVFENRYSAHYFKNNSLDISYLPNGIYLLQLGETILKYKKL